MVKQHLAELLPRPQPLLSGVAAFCMHARYGMDSLKLSVQGVTKTYRDGRKLVEALAPIDLTVADGEFVTLIGPSGCGKSTLFNIIAGVDEPSSGTVAINGEASGKRAGLSGYMPQQPLLLPWRTVEENVMLGLDVRRVPRKQALHEALELLKRFGLADFAQNYPATLSGGMRQRVALLRTVLFNPSFLLLDEPFGALDALTRLSLQMWLLDLWQSLHASVLFITHDVREALLLSDRIYVLSARPARVLRVVEVDLPRPRRQEHLALEPAVRLEQELLALLLKEQQL
ncbi:MAG: ABC transporter ATP-binding protein [Ktedonobacteraceae bacterium]